MAAISIFYGSVFGNAQNVAERVCEHFSEKGIDCKVVQEPSVQELQDAEAIFAVSSTCGLGDVPPNLEGLVTEARDQSLDLSSKRFAVAALGDSTYVDTFCGGGKKVYALLEELKANAVAPVLEVDAIETFEPDADVIEWMENIVGELAA
ncbi:MAG: flavodoxin domain-containing protein [Planctomycetota bacterium]